MMNIKKCARNLLVQFMSIVQSSEKKVKVHMILHLPENVKDFGPTSAFNTETIFGVVFVQTTSVSFIDVKLLIPSFGLEIYMLIA